jgi:CPW-WPC domain-containing protein
MSPIFLLVLVRIADCGMMSLGGMLLSKLGDNPLNPIPGTVNTALAKLALYTPPPVPAPVLLDPNFQPLCEKDYAGCPFGFVSVGPIFGDKEYCAADLTRYTGRCANEPVTFSGYTKEAMEQWADYCGIYWPCIRCKRDYQSQPCPKNWNFVNGKLCQAPVTYTGNCDKTGEDFRFYTDEAREDWSFACGAYWMCLK